MKTSEIDTILHSLLEGTRVHFAGVFPRNLIPSIETLKTPSCFVSNTDESHSPGEHWVAFYIANPNRIEFFDSYGMPPSVYGFTLNVSCYNTTQYQSFDSNVCGHYCIFYLYVRSIFNSNKPLDSYFSKHNHILNDLNVRKWVKHHSKFIAPSSNCKFTCIQSCKCKNK